MQFRVFEIERNKGYTFLIGCREAPTSRLREQIGGTLAGAWGELFEGKREVPPYGLELVPDSAPPTGENELPVLLPGGTYMIFVLLESNSGSSVGEPETVSGILRAIEGSLGNSEIKPRIALVALYNCSVQVLESKMHTPAFLPIIHNDPFREDLFPRSWRDRER